MKLFDKLKILSGAGGIAAHDGGAAHKWQHHLRWMVFLALLATIPAFYLQLGGINPYYQRMGALIYLAAAIFLAGHALIIASVSDRPWSYLKRNWSDAAIALGAFLSFSSSGAAWSTLEWILRTLLIMLIVLRLILALRHFFSPTGTLYLLGMGIIGLGLAGLGFYWLEPSVQSYADGLWLAFVSGSSVGYGDLIPTTPAARIFAVFVIIFGSMMMSLVTASLTAMFVEKEEHQIELKLHHDIKELRRELEQLRAELQKHNPRGALLAKRSPGEGAT
ncbi:MAG TPA: potassium channel family protein [Gammaproteobacteria bacterium]|nr:potassium channel family protein [Gammaproteobacteria bacterium]